MSVARRIPGDLMTVEQVAVYLQLNKLTIYKFIRAGELAAIRLGRSFRVRRVDVDQFLDTHKVTPKRTGAPTTEVPHRPGAPLRPQVGPQRREHPSEAESAESAARREERRRLREAMVSSNPLEWVTRGLH